jgi:hypothetical protein
MQYMFPPKVIILIRGVEFLANLIVLESKGIDVILGMDWLSKHNGLIDCAKKAVRLTPSCRKNWNMWKRTWSRIKQHPTELC